MPSATTRTLLVHGALNEKTGRYRLETRTSLTPITRGGDTRHTLQLRSLEPDVYRWDTNVDMGIGPISAAEVSNLCVALFRAAEGRTDAQVRDDYRSAFPRTSAVFGRGFAIDSLRVAPAPGGGTSVSITAGFHPETMRESYPALAQYLDKYLGPAKYHFTLAEKDGTPLLDVVGRDRFVTFRYRVAAGTSSRRSRSDQAVAGHAAAHVRHQAQGEGVPVGFHELVTDFVISNVGHDRAMDDHRAARAEVGPAVRHRAVDSHRRFTGRSTAQGSLFQLAVRDTAGGQTVFSRRTRFDVQESTIMRFLGSLGPGAMAISMRRVEAEEDRFLRDGFVAMQADLKTAARAWHRATKTRPETKKTPPSPELVAFGPT